MPTSNAQLANPIVISLGATPDQPHAEEGREAVGQRLVDPS
jgi:hypothetical protein